jgi:hypothetical protein
MTTTLNASTAGAGGFIATSDNSGILALQTAGTTAVTIDTSQRAAFVAGTAALPAITTTGDTNTGIFFPAADTIAFSEGGAESMRIDSSGNLLVGTSSSAFGTAPRIETRVADGRAIGISNSGTGTATAAIFINNTGSGVGSITYTTTTTSYNTSSDYRLKETISPMTGALAKVSQLKPVTYKWKADGSNGEGFIAHELAEIVPDCVTGEKNAVDSDGKPVYQGIDTSFLVATLTAALQETKALIDTQAATINALTARIVALESK